jgi:hypothetical protein
MSQVLRIAHCCRIKRHARYASDDQYGRRRGFVFQQQVNLYHLVSLGGTSTIFTCLAIGIILSISRSVYNPELFETQNAQDDPELGSTSSSTGMNEEYTQTSIRAIISGGGTGGHIFPAIAIARAISGKGS